MLVLALERTISGWQATCVEIKRHNPAGAADLSSRIAFKGYKRGPFLKMRILAPPEFGFVLRPTDVGNIIATSKMYLCLRGGKSGLESKIDL